MASFPAFCLPRPTTAVLTAFFSRVTVQPNGCWLWTGAANGKGYAAFDGTSAHRVTYAWFVGTIPADHEVDHLCRTRRCVHPAHGDAVTGRENRWRANRFENTGRCKRGHALAVVGFARNNDQGLDRLCRQCRRITQARYNRRNELPLGEVLATALAQENLRLATEAARQSHRRTA